MLIALLVCQPLQTKWEADSYNPCGHRLLYGEISLSTRSGYALHLADGYHSMADNRGHFIRQYTPMDKDYP
mgnify:CR=1 FL=1